MSHSPRHSLEHKLEQTLDAYKKTRYRELEREPIILDQLDDIGTVMVSPFFDDPDETDAKHQRNHWRERLAPLLEVYMDARWGEADDIADVLDDAMYKLRLNSGVEEGHDPADQIRANTAGWDGPAGDRFHEDHLPPLDDALRFQQEMALALSGIIKTQGAIVESAYKQAKDLLQQAREALDAEADELQRESRHELQKLVSDTVLVALAGEIEGPAKAVQTALETVGEAIATLDFHPTGNADSIMHHLKTALHHLHTLTDDELTKVHNALDRCNDYLNGDRRNEFMPIVVPLSLRNGPI
jgi:hypothetical protein